MKTVTLSRHSRTEIGLGKFLQVRRKPRVLAVRKMAKLARADPRRVTSVFKVKLLRFDDESRTGCKKEDDIEHPREGENCVGGECELVGSEISIQWAIFSAAEREHSRYGVRYDRTDVDHWVTDGKNNLE